MPSDDEDDLESEFSDCDYHLEKHQVATLYDISEDRSHELWNKQSGLCYITNIPLGFGNGMYDAVVAPRRITEQTDDTNSVIVCRCVSLMREATGYTWTQFKALLANVSQNLE